MGHGKRDQEVIIAAGQLEHAIQTSIMQNDDSPEAVIVRCLIDEDAGGGIDWDQEIADRVKYAYKNLRHALEVRGAALSEHDDVVELEVVAVRLEPGHEGIALKAGNRMLIIDGPQILAPIVIKPGDTLQVRVK